MSVGHGTSQLKQAWGGVVVDDEGRILLREVANHYDGYVWTFPKGRPELGETPEEAALREVREETGVEAEVVERIPGHFAGGTTTNSYFVLSVLAEQGDFDPNETTSVRWATYDEASDLIAQTTNSTGRFRDLAVLDSLMNLDR